MTMQKWNVFEFHTICTSQCLANLKRNTLLKNETRNDVTFDIEVGVYENNANIEAEKARIDYEKQGKLAQWKWEF